MKHAFWLLVLLALFSCQKTKSQAQADRAVSIWTATDQMGHRVTLTLNMVPSPEGMNYEGRLVAPALRAEPIGFYGMKDSTGAISADVSIRYEGEDYEKRPIMRLTLVGTDTLITNYINWPKSAASLTLVRKKITDPCQTYHYEVFADSLQHKHQTDSVFSRVSIRNTVLVPDCGGAKMQDMLFLFYDSTATNTTKAFASSRDEWFAMFKEEMAYVDTIPEMYAMMYDRETQSSLMYADDNYESFEFTFYEYSGGAHPNHASIFRSYKKGNAKALIYSDLFKGGKETEMLLILERHLRQQYQLDPNQPLSQILFDDTLTLTDNIAVVGDGISFLYNPYEIAAYAVGSIEIWIPFADLKDILK
jgi:Protein of unknown function (DUF3298)